MMRKITALVIALISYQMILGQQVADTTYNPSISKPMYEIGKGSIVFIDEGHHNFHTKEGRYKAFSNLLERDGYVVKPYKGIFTKEQLSQGKILVISNALNKINVTNWVLPTPSAFTKEEIKTLKNWVSEGGSLFLIADHMPMAGAAEDLAKVFGFTFTNGFVIHETERGAAVFTKENKSLSDNPITRGREASEAVDQIATFTGQAFEVPEDATPILTFPKNYINLLPDTAWVFHRKTKTLTATGWSQGAYKKYQKGRVVVFGEAAMFTAQLSGPQQRKTGMSNPVAPQNYKLLLNIIHWLDKKLD